MRIALGLSVALPFVLVAGCGGSDTYLCQPSCPQGSHCAASGCVSDSPAGNDMAAGGGDLAMTACTPACTGTTLHCNANHVCVACIVDADCPLGQTCKQAGAATICVPGCSDDSRCDSQQGMKCCGGQCVDSTRDPQNCGACNKSCGAQHSSARCAAGVCMAGMCDPGWGDCNNKPDDGCEANLHIDTANCGKCGTACKYAHASAGCSDACYLAACDFGWDDCNNMLDDGCEKDVSADRSNCGGCGKLFACGSVPNATNDCVNAFCTLTGCNMGFLDCDGNAKNGCEVNGATDAANCGGCGMACPQGLVCRGSRCTCPQCNIPNASSTCNNNQCVLDKCNLGFADCDNNPQNGCEVNINTDANNCSACNMKCPQNAPFCFNGVCSVYTPPKECNGAKQIDDASRNVNNANGSTCDNNGTINGGWYQFVGATGVKIPTAPPPISHCGTDAPGWMQGAYPNFGDNIVTRTVCYNWAGNQCEWMNPIQVINCGNYYVFQLPAPPVCNLRYCGTN